MPDALLRVVNADCCEMNQSQPAARMHVNAHLRGFTRSFFDPARHAGAVS
jgi:hypothetical protein